MAKPLLTFFLFFYFGLSQATHIYSGYLEYEQDTVNPLKFLVRAVLFSDANAQAADRCEIALDNGDTLFRVNNGAGTNCTCTNGNCGELVLSNILKSVYEGYTYFSSSGTHPISFTYPNMVDGILNVPNSVNKAFLIKDTLVINNWLGLNNSPKIAEINYFEVCVGDSLRMNFGVYDEDGDSLVYSIEPYFAAGSVFPNDVGSNSGGSFTISGDSASVLWCSPQLMGYYTYILRISEYRNGVFIASYHAINFISAFGTCPNSSFCTVGIKQLTNKGFLIYPNPISNGASLNIDFSEKNGFVSIFDSHGKLIYSQNLTQGTNQLLIGDKLKSSLYFYQIVSEQQVIKSGKLTIEN